MELQMVIDVVVLVLELCCQHLRSLVSSRIVVLQVLTLVMAMGGRLDGRRRLWNVYLHGNSAGFVTRL